MAAVLSMLSRAPKVQTTSSLSGSVVAATPVCVALPRKKGQSFPEFGSAAGRAVVRMRSSRDQARDRGRSIFMDRISPVYVSRETQAAPRLDPLPLSQRRLV